jgi:hypothetical protein
MSLQSHALVLAAGLLCAAAAQAGVAVTADLGSTGVGAHLVVPMETYLNGRFGINYLKHDFDKTSGAIRYDIKGKVQTVDALFDFYPRAGSTFRLTGGLVYNGSKFDARANPDALGKFLINGVEYGAADVGLLHGRIDFRKAAPYLGLGWGNALAPARITRAIPTCSCRASAAPPPPRCAARSPATLPQSGYGCRRRPRRSSFIRSCAPGSHTVSDEGQAISESRRWAAFYLRKYYFSASTLISNWKND